MRSPHPTVTRSAPTHLTPAGADAAATVAVAFHGDDDVVVSVRGPLDAAAVRRATRLLAVADVEGARHVIVDVVGSPDAHAALRGALDPLRTRLQARGGWLLVEGAPAAPQEPSLLDVFAAYAQATRGDEARIPAPRAVLVG
ncbi:hypothetical protein PSU4_08580 [Pseudonocardia sulfidoxydans NBRC 16205]|uniref:STAS domain-containing protein n=1 Tax=Pseudonocardia sulfidoxydans NBRC 16205 TaxID=1223511 RepID=A0A511DDY3_9PSEU|nr:hypothetical protein PSU4_08580 [Pseudonocardia sulfidoxydans NBRC 16205]